MTGSVPSTSARHMGIYVALVDVIYVGHFGLHFEETKLLLLSLSQLFLNL